MTELQIVFPVGALGASEFGDALDTVLREIAVRASTDPDGEWSEKYGTDFENDEFMMHRYCRCVRDDCAWCGGCQVEHEFPGHSDVCYQAELRERERAAGLHYTQWEQWNIRPGNGQYEKKQAAHDALYEELTQKYGLSRYGCAVHCTCGADEAYRLIVDACECDWHMGRAQFRFGPAREGPHFWHKPSGFMVWWYKYIGRSVKTDGTPPTNLLERCLASLESKP